MVLFLLVDQVIQSMLFFGALRSAAQMISYEVSIGIIIIVVLISAGSLNLTDIVVSQQNI